MPDGRSVPVFRLVNDAADRRFLLTNQDAYSLTYNGLVMVVEKRRSSGWQAFGSYSFSRAYGLQASNATTASARDEWSAIVQEQSRHVRNPAALP